MIPVFYYIQGETGENPKVPNLFFVSSPSKGNGNGNSNNGNSSNTITLGDLVDQFPLKGASNSDFLWRFRVNEASTNNSNDICNGYYWLDVTDLNDPVPIMKPSGNVVAKLLRLSSLKNSYAAKGYKRIGIYAYDAVLQTSSLGRNTSTSSSTTASSSSSYGNGGVPPRKANSSPALPPNKPATKPQPSAASTTAAAKKSTESTASVQKSTSATSAAAPASPSKAKQQKAPAQQQQKKIDEDIMWVSAPEEMSEKEAMAAASASGNSKQQDPNVPVISQTVTDDDDDPVLKTLKTAEERAAYRINKRKEVEKKLQDEKLNQARVEEEARQKAQLDRDEIKRKLGPKLLQWAGPEGNRKPIRALLSTMHNVLWEGARWKQVTILVQPEEVRKAYRLAMLLVHPDKVSKDAPVEVKFIAEMCYQYLVPEWNKFEQTELNKQ